MGMSERGGLSRIDSARGRAVFLLAIESEKAHEYVPEVSKTPRPRGFFGGAWRIPTC